MPLPVPEDAVHAEADVEAVLTRLEMDVAGGVGRGACNHALGGLSRLRALGHVETPLHRRGTGLTPARALALLATLQSADIILPTTDGREIRLRRVTRPTPEQQQQLLDQLDITIPTHLEWNAECSGDFAAS